MKTTDPSAWSRRRFLGATVAASGLAVAGLTGLAGCSLGKASTPDPSQDTGEKSGWSGEVDEPGIPKPDVTLTDMDGNPYPIAEKTKGKLTLLFFGYTSCPDVCPTTLNALGQALETVGTGDGGDPIVLFVGVDVARDTPEQLKRYLGRVNPTFIGLTGSEKDIAEANRQVFNGPIVIEEPDADGEYLVGHSKKVFAYSPEDDLAHRYYPGDEMRPGQWVNDLPRLSRGEFQ